MLFKRDSLIDIGESVSNWVLLSWRILPKMHPVCQSLTYNHIVIWCHYVQKLSWDIQDQCLAKDFARSKRFRNAGIWFHSFSTDTTRKLVARTSYYCRQALIKLTVVSLDSLLSFSAVLIYVWEYRCAFDFKSLVSTYNQQWK